MTKFVDENSKLKMANLKAIHRIAVLMFSSIVYIVLVINH